MNQYLEGFLNRLWDRLRVVQVFFKLNENLWRIVRNIVGEGVDDTTQSQNSRVKLGKGAFVL